MSTSEKHPSSTDSSSVVAPCPPTWPDSLVAYFRSGWAFLIPYLAAYLFYAWLKWPVNPATSGEGFVNGMSESETGVGKQRSLVPCLLYVYWFLHGVHLILGGFTLRTWWRNTQYSALNSQPVSNAPIVWPCLYPVIPWLALALIFWIPGTYLEWPADPWEHFRRITEWTTHSIAGAHSAGYKSFYFFTYSFLVSADPAEQITRLDLYSTFISLLLAWQYYRLARTVGLDNRWAFVSVLANVYLFGNVCFSFYRYYGLASTMYSQLGAVALTRIALEAAKSPQFTLGALVRLPFAVLHPSPNVGRLLLSSAALLALIASNHLQGIGIAGVCLVSISVWRTLQGKPARIWWIVGVALALSITTCLWWPRHPTIDSVYRPGGWLNVWYGFNFAWPSPSADRTMQILGLFGLINLLAGIVLLWRNHIVGWLTVGPIIALSLPFVALPFANQLAEKSISEIVTFHRMFFAIPSGLAVVCCLSIAVKPLTVFSIQEVSRARGFFAIITTIAGFILLASDSSSYNRFWHFIRVTPQDLQLRPLVNFAESTMARLYKVEDYRLITTDTFAYVFKTTYPTQFDFHERHINQPVSETLTQSIAHLLSSKPTIRGNKLILNHDPLTTDRTAWVTFAGSAPESTLGITDFRASSSGLQNPPGKLSEILTSDLIPIDPTNAYRLEMSLKQSTGTQATAYLTVAWYNDRGVLLDSNIPKPSGAGFPAGWENGTFSYYGLIGTPAPTKWTTYRTSFGRDEVAAIPSNAKSVRVGALLNFNAIPGAVIQMSNIHLWQKKGGESIHDGTFQQYFHCFLAISPDLLLFSPSSQAGVLSGHWPAQAVATALAGEKELESAAHSFEAVTTNTED